MPTARSYTHPSRIFSAASSPLRQQSNSPRTSSRAGWFSGSASVLRRSAPVEAYCSRQPFCPQVQSSPPGYSTMWPNSPAPPPAPVISCPLAIAAPPTPVPSASITIMRQPWAAPIQRSPSAAAFTSFST